MEQMKELINLPLKFKVEEVLKVTNVGVCLKGEVLEGILLENMKLKIGPSQLKTTVIAFEAWPSRFLNGVKPLSVCVFSISNPELYPLIKKGDIAFEDK